MSIASDTSTDFPLWEGALGRRLGQISRNELRQLREQHLQEGTDWVKRSNRICWSEQALEKIAAEIAPGAAGAAGQGGDSGGPQKTPPAQSCAAIPACEKAEPEAFVVWRADLQNTRVVVCVREGRSMTDPREHVVVRVHDARKFVRGMRLRAQEERPGQWHLVGRAPRYRGKW